MQPEYSHLPLPRLPFCSHEEREIIKGTPSRRRERERERGRGRGRSREQRRMRNVASNENIILLLFLENHYYFPQIFIK
jgi:hypothetical protein